MPSKPDKRKKVTAPHHLSVYTEETVEVLDENGRSFMLMPRMQVLRQQLPHRVALVVLRNRERKIYIHRKATQQKNYAGLWHVSAYGSVKAGEAMEDAALRKLYEELGVSGISLSQAAELPASAQSGWGQLLLFLTRPSNVIINPAPAEIGEGMFVDPEEFENLARNMPECLNPALIWAAGACDLFAGL